MKIVAISDTHNMLDKISLPKGDVLVHAGDLTGIGNVLEMSKELALLKKIGKDFKHIIYVCGNHDGLGEDNPPLLKDLCKALGIIYLDHEPIYLNGVKIFGSAYTPFFNNWYFNLYPGDELKHKWAQIPEDTEVLITHGPPKGILDSLIRYNRVAGEMQKENLGCQDLRDRLRKLKNLKVHIFGHIHNGYGTKTLRGVTYINASICTEEYKPINKPIEFTLKRK